MPTGVYIRTKEYRELMSKIMKRIGHKPPSTLGRKMSEESRRKLSETRKGIRFSEEHKRKLSVSHKGIPSWNKGGALTDDHKKKIGESNRGKKRAPEVVERLREIGKVAFLGKRHSEEIKEHWSRVRRGKYVGNEHPNWRGGITPINTKIRHSIEYKLWRKSVFERDNYTCVQCNVRGGVLNADHIKPFALFPELRLEFSNGRTLCVSCHKKTDTYCGKLQVFARKNALQFPTHIKSCLVSTCKT